jgi:hypothetical protein
MQPALACLNIGTSLPPWMFALLPLNWLFYPAAALPLVIAFSALLLWGVPAQTRGKMVPWLAIGTITAFIAVGSYSLIDRLSPYVAGISCISFLIALVAFLFFSRALQLRNVALTERSPDIPGVPDDLAAQRAITHRPYRRRGFHRRWR